MNHIPRKRFGQHFLIDQQVLMRIVDEIGPMPGDNLVEIGPGAGALTRHLLARHGALQAVEIDRDLCAELRRQFAAKSLTLHEADVLDFDFRRLGAAPRIVGNLPYNISTPLLFRIASDVPDLVDGHFMLQEEVVDRMAARPSTPDYSRLTVMIQARFTVEKLFSVPADAFRPPPKVTSAVVRLAPLSPGTVCVDDWPTFVDLVRRVFTQRRKMLRNAFADLLSAQELERLGVDITLRPENLSVNDYARLANFVVGRNTDITRADAG